MYIICRFNFLSYKKNEEWFADFKRGRTNGDDAERSSRPIKVITSGNIREVHEIILANRQVKLNEIADTLRLSEESVYFRAFAVLFGDV